MKNNDFVQLFETLVSTHTSLRHNEVGVDYPTGKRRSFYRINSEAENIQAIGMQIDYPCLCLLPVRGQYRSGNDHLVMDIMTGEFDIRMHVDDVNNYTLIEDVRDECKEIGMSIIAEILRLYLDEESCSGIDNFDPNSVYYHFIGPLNNNEFGVRFGFSFQDVAFDITTIDLDNIFNL